MMSKARIIAFAILGTLLALSSCRDLSLDPVFYALEKEKPLAEDRYFPKDVSVQRMVTSGTRYFAVANQLYIRDVLDPDPDPEHRAKWTVVAPPTSLTHPMCNTLELFGVNIYVGFFDYVTGDGQGLWKAPADLSSGWTNVSDTDVDDEEIVMVRAVGTELFVSTRAGGINNLCHGDGTIFTTVTWDVAPGDISIKDVAQDSSLNNYWVIAGPYIYMDTAGDFSSFDRYNTSGSITNAPAPLSGALTFGGLFVTGTTLYVSAHDGQLYRTADGGGTWTKTPSPILYNDDPDTPVGFTAFALPLADAGAVYVGTQSYGYYRIPGGNVTATPTREPSYNISALYNGAVNSFYYDSTLSRLFLCTAGAGLWRGEYESGSDWTWKQE
jgi:hypothetical protein